MNRIGKKVLVSSIAASVMFGSAMYLQDKAFAASTDNSSMNTEQSTSGNASSSEAVKSSVDGDTRSHGRGGHKGGNLLSETAEVLGIEISEIQTQLEAGKTFADIAEGKGLTKEVFLQKLIDLETSKIEERLSEGKLTDTQAAEQKEKLIDRLGQAIESSDIGRAGHSKKDGIGLGLGRLGKTEEIAGILSMTEDELKAGLKEGKTLAELAAAKGITEADLIQKLKDNMTTSLKEWVNEKHTAPDKKAETIDAETADAKETGDI